MECFYKFGTKTGDIWGILAIFGHILGKFMKNLKGGRAILFILKRGYEFLAGGYEAIFIQI